MTYISEGLNELQNALDINNDQSTLFEIPAHSSVVVTTFQYCSRRFHTLASIENERHYRETSLRQYIEDQIEHGRTKWCKQFKKQTTSLLLLILLLLITYGDFQASIAARLLSSRHRGYLHARIFARRSSIRLKFLARNFSHQWSLRASGYAGPAM